MLEIASTTSTHVRQLTIQGDSEGKMGDIQLARRFELHLENHRKQLGSLLE